MAPLQKHNVCVTARQNQATKEQKRDAYMQSKCEKPHR